MIRIKHFSTIDSTNLEAERIIEQKSCQPPFVIIADEQTQGKGQGNHKWETVKNQNLTFSLVLNPNIQCEKQFLITVFTSVAIMEFIDQIINNVKKVSTKIKWSNDIYVNDSKICGILISNKICNNKIINSIIGIGVNINQTIFPENIPNPTSLKLITNKEFSLDETFKLLIDRLMNNYDIILNNPKILIDKYSTNLYKLGEPYAYTINGKKEVRIIKGINDIGEMIWE